VRKSGSDANDVRFVHRQGQHRTAEPRLPVRKYRVVEDDYADFAHEDDPIAVAPPPRKATRRSSCSASWWSGLGLLAEATPNDGMDPAG